MLEGGQYLDRAGFGAAPYFAVLQPGRDQEVPRLLSAPLHCVCPGNVHKSHETCLPHTTGSSPERHS